VTLRDKIINLLLCSAAVAAVIAMVLRPEIAYDAAVEGLETWWGIVFPALMPFFIGAQILLGLGIVHAMGVILEPIMRPLFNVPGCGSFVLAMGLASGYPIGAVLTGNMRRDFMLNRYEAERLVSIANTADPLFMSGAVAVGIFHNPNVAALIMVAHYLSALANGLIVRFYAPNAPTSEPTPDARKGPVLYRAVGALLAARERDGRPLGTLLGDAVRKSFDTLILIGGLIILISVVINVLEATAAAAVLHYALGGVLSALHLSSELAGALTRGLFEITLGCQAVGTAPAALSDRLIITGAVIGWSGFSVHAQVAALLHDTDINILPYVCSRAVHALLAGLTTWLLLPLAPELDAHVAVLSPVLQASTIELGWFEIFTRSAVRFGITGAIAFGGGLAAHALGIAGRR